MRNLTATLCLTLAVLVGSAREGFALPPCPSDQNRYYDNCFGTKTYPNGGKYVGEFRNNKLHGKGTHTFASGNKYVGAFMNGKIHGQGTYTWANGQIYSGGFRNNKRHGQGTLTFSAPHKGAGAKYVGAFKSGKYNGQGTFTFADGRIKAGFYRHGKVVKPSQYLAEEVWEQIFPCWNILVGINVNNYRPIKITIELTKNGALEKPPTILNSNLYKNDFIFRARAESAIRALKNPRCVPLKLPLSLYDSWKKISISIDEREMVR